MENNYKMMWYDVYLQIYKIKLLHGMTTSIFHKEKKEGLNLVWIDNHLKLTSTNPILDYLLERYISFLFLPKTKSVSGV